MGSILNSANYIYRVGNQNFKSYYVYVVRLFE